jgi:hypothetical protein
MSQAFLDELSLSRRVLPFDSFKAPFFMYLSPAFLIVIMFDGSYFIFAESYVSVSELSPAFLLVESRFSCGDLFFESYYLHGMNPAYSVNRGISLLILCPACSYYESAVPAHLVSWRIYSLKCVKNITLSDLPPFSVYLVL